MLAGVWITVRNMIQNSPLYCNFVLEKSIVSAGLQRFLFFLRKKKQQAMFIILFRISVDIWMESFNRHSYSPSPASLQSLGLTGSSAVQNPVKLTCLALGQ